MTKNSVEHGLHVSNLLFAYPGRTLFAAWEHSFSGGITWVQGHNGCGKSTLLKLLGGALAPLAGNIRIGTVDAHAHPIDYRREVYWCAPEGIVFDHLSSAEYFGFIANLYPNFDKVQAANLVVELGLTPFLHQRIKELSTGTQRKVAVLAAIAVNTSAVLLDEPLAALDKAALTVVRSYLLSAAEQKNQIWIVTSHESLGMAESLYYKLDLSSSVKL